MSGFPDCGFPAYFCHYVFHRKLLLSQKAAKIENPAGPIFRAFFSLSFMAKISLESLCKQGRDPNDIFALKEKGKIALKIGPVGFSIFFLLFEYSLKNTFRVAKISWKTRRDP